MRPPWIFVVNGWALLAVFLVACTRPDSGFVKAMESAAGKASGSTNAVVTLSTLTDYQWDKLFVFGPYTPVQQIYSQLGFVWAGAEKTHIDSSDTFYLLVFVKDGKVIRHFKLPRTVGDFQALEARNVFVPGNDTLEVKAVERPNGRRFNFMAKQRKEPSASFK